MKKPLILIIGIILGFSLAFIFAGFSTGQQGVARSLNITLTTDYYFHFHHWMWAFIILVGITAYGANREYIRQKLLYFFLIGFFTGIILHGIFMYNDWYILVFPKPL